MDFGSHSFIWIILVGLVIGAIAKLLMPGKDPGGCIVTICSASPVRLLARGSVAFYGPELRRRLDYVDRWRDDLVAAVSIAFQARRIGAR